MIKLAITGKGGVGKTTLASLLAHLYAAEGNNVIAIDADPDANFAMALGLTQAQAQQITPIAELEDLIEERTGAKPGSGAPFFKLNPRVDDIPERFSVKIDGIRLLIMGTVKSGGGGCMCPESALLKSLMSHLLFRESDVVIMDMDAGVEHIGRGTAQAVDILIIVVEPGRRSEFITNSLPDFEVLGFINYNPKIREADLSGKSVFDADPAVVEEVRAIKEKLERKEGK